MLTERDVKWMYKIEKILESQDIKPDADLLLTLCRGMQELAQKDFKEILTTIGNITVGGLMTKLKYNTDFHDICSKYGVEV